jgi:hypothetical protein
VSTQRPASSVNAASMSRMDRLRISAHRGRPFQANVDGISDERGRCFKLIVDDVAA